MNLILLQIIWCTCVLLGPPCYFSQFFLSFNSLSLPSSRRQTPDPGRYRHQQTDQSRHCPARSRPLWKDRRSETPVGSEWKWSSPVFQCDRELSSFKLIKASKVKLPVNLVAFSIIVKCYRWGTNTYKETKGEEGASVKVRHLDDRKCLLVF